MLHYLINSSNNNEQLRAQSIIYYVLHKYLFSLCHLFISGNHTIAVVQGEKMISHSKTPKPC